MRCFENIARLIRKKRVTHPKAYSQSELSHLLGYKNGQFISNVERALCNIPLKMLSRVSEILDIPSEDLKVAILKDQEITLEHYLKESAPGTVHSYENKSPEDKNISGGYHTDEKVHDHDYDDDKKRRIA